MIKQYKRDRSRWSTPKAEWPKNPSDVPTLFSRRKPLRKLQVLVDADLIAATTSGDILDKTTMLMALLKSEAVEFYRYADGQPPPDIEPFDDPVFDARYPVYAGWVTAHQDEYDPRLWHVGYATDPRNRMSMGGVYGDIVEVARHDKSEVVYAELNHSQRADKRASDMLALQVGEQGIGADIFITERPYLHSRSRLVARSDVTICTRDEAIPLIALYLRAQHEFVLPTGLRAGDHIGRFRFDRGLYFWVGTRELLPEAWRWFSACVQYSSATGNDKLMLLGNALLSRVAKALKERDDVHFALNRQTTKDDSDDALSSLDNVLVSLMGSVDVTARVAHTVLKLSTSERTAAWQFKDWLKSVGTQSPALAAVVQGGTTGEHTLTILKHLRNLVHGAGLQGVMYFRDGKGEPRIKLLPEDESAILPAMDAMGGRGTWGVQSLGGGISLVQPALLVDRLFSEVLTLLNDLMKETPIELLSNVTITEENCRPPSGNPSRGKLDPFAEWNRLAIRWQLGF